MNRTWLVGHQLINAGLAGFARTVSHLGSEGAEGVIIKVADPRISVTLRLKL